DAPFGLDDPVVEISIWQDGIIPEKKEEKKEEKKDDAKKDEQKDKKKDEIKPPPVKRPSLKGEPNVRLKFGKKEKDLVYVRRIIGPISNRVAVSEAVLAVANRPLLDYLDPTLKSFDVLLAAKLAVRRGSVTTEVTKEKDDIKELLWKLT